MIRNRFWIFTGSIVIAFIILNIIFHGILYFRTPQNTVYTFSSGHLGDFYAYTAMITRGQAGHILYHNIFSVLNPPDVFVHPLFHLLGLLTGFSNIPPYIVFFAARLMFLGLLVLLVGKLAAIIFPKGIAKYIALIIFISASAAWQVVSEPGGLVIKYAYEYTDYFDLFKKIHYIPPHHLLAHAFVICSLLLLTQKTLKIHNLILLSGTAVAIGLLHPDVLQFLLIISGFNLLFCLLWDANKKQNLVLFSVLAISAVAILTFEAYQVIYILHHTEPLSALFQKSARPISFLTYLQLLGPVSALSIFAYFRKTTYSQPLMRLLALWGLIPFLIFFLPDWGINTSVYRVFQYYQHIPLAILATQTLNLLTQKIHHSVFLILFAIFFVSYGFLPYFINFSNRLKTMQPNYMNIYLPKSLLTTFRFLAEHSQPDSHVLAGQTVSSMLPTFSHNKVPFGHDSSYQDFSQIRDGAYGMYSGTLSPADLQTYLNKFHFSYIIFGIDAPEFSQTPYTTLPFLKPIYENNSIRIIEVRN